MKPRVLGVSILIIILLSFTQACRSQTDTTASAVNPPATTTQPTTTAQSAPGTTLTTSTATTATITTSTTTPITNTNPATAPASAPTALSGRIKLSVSFTAFSPASLNIQVGSTVMLNGSGHYEYTIASLIPGEEKQILADGATLQMMFFDKGSFTYWLLDNPEVRYTIIVV